MAKIRYKETTLDSFYGNFLYDQVIPKGHFLVKLKEVIDWQRFTKKLIKRQGKDRTRLFSNRLFNNLIFPTHSPLEASLTNLRECGGIAPERNSRVGGWEERVNKHSQIGQALRNRPPYLSYLR